MGHPVDFLRIVRLSFPLKLSWLIYKQKINKQNQLEINLNKINSDQFLHYLIFLFRDKKHKGIA